MKISVIPMHACPWPRKLRSGLGIGEKAVAKRNRVR